MCIRDREKDYIEGVTFSGGDPLFEMCIRDRSGAGPEVFQSDFTYKGFRYAEVRGECRIENVTARSFHTYVKERGGFQCSDSRVNRIMEAVRNSTLSNLHHTITDCPHREKNGWLGDAHASCEQALLQFDMEKIYRHYLDAVADCQWPSGQLPCIAQMCIRDSVY